MPVVNIKETACEVYIGRSQSAEHFGNPFTHIRIKTLAVQIVGSREEAIASFEAWITGEAFAGIEPTRRTWILEHLYLLKGKVLGCHCKPLACHGDVLERLANE